MQLHRNSSQIKLAGSKKSCLHVADASGMNLEAINTGEDPSQDSHAGCSHPTRYLGSRIEQLRLPYGC